MFFTYSNKKKFKGVMSGDLSGHGIGPPLPIQHLRNFSSKTSHTSKLQCGSGKCYCFANPLFEEMQKFQAYQGNCLNYFRKEKRPYNSNMQT
ncbi:hypothetical protein AVEN_274642-1 [Araneus ventricosus]|uniref:Uncharacterized protein n=1 Tax=Araneus ventricosus TaxID=182803 RepID=A0A4Y2FCY0_ARAVE|nr:hypothetical protein AVEN_274642-1 [Araneus ventricosus]